MKELTEEQKEAVKSMSSPAQMDAQDAHDVSTRLPKSSQPSFFAVKERRCWYAALDRTMQNAEKKGPEASGHPPTYTSACTQAVIVLE